MALGLAAVQVTSLCCSVCRRPCPRKRLVVDTVGFNDKSWLDGHGMTHSDRLHTVERFHRRGAVLEYGLTIEDPKTFTRPWTVHMDYEAKPDWKIAEYICNENNRNDK